MDRIALKTQGHITLILFRLTQCPPQKELRY